MKYKNMIEKVKRTGRHVWYRFLEGLGLEWIVESNKDIEYEV